MKCPAEIYLDAQQPYNGLPELAYPFHCNQLCRTIGLDLQVIIIAIFGAQLIGGRGQLADFSRIQSSPPKGWAF